MTSDNKTLDAAGSEVDERSIGKKYGLRELVYPDSEHVKALTAFLNETVESGRCGVIPRTGVVMLLDFLQGTINRQHITKGPRMTQEEFDTLQAPYYLAARAISKIQRARQESTKGRVYQATYVSLGQFIEVLRNLVDPGCPWTRARSIPDNVRDVMAALRDFLVLYPEQRRKGRAV